MQIGFIGLGRLGRAMAEHLVARGRSLVVWNRTEDRAEGLPAPIAASPADLAAESRTIVVNLFDSDAVTAVLEGPGGLLQAPLDDKLVIDTTTHHPDRVRELHRVIAERGGHYLEAPVLGSVVPASQGMLTILVSGSQKAFERALPLLEEMGRDIFYLGAPGQATRMKLVNNALFAVVMTGLAEAVDFAERAGLSRETAIEILSRGAGNSAVLAAKRDKLVHDDFAPQFSVEALDKDLRYAADLAASVTAALPMTALARRLYHDALAAGQGEMDVSVIYETLKLG